jgi:CheY-like chemotaxis protein
VLEADSGHEALEDLMNTPVDLTILDLSMPEMDGLEVLRAAKYMPKPKTSWSPGFPPPSATPCWKRRESLEPPPLWISNTL